MEKARDSRSGWNYDDFSCCSLQEQQYFYKEATEACVGPDETKRSVSEALHLDMFLFAFLVFFPSAPSLDSGYYYVFYAASVILLALFFFFYHCDRQRSECSTRVHFLFSQTVGFLELFEEKTHHSQTAL